MAQHNATNFGNRWQYADDLDDHVDEDNIQGPGLDLNAHDHSDTYGLPTKRVKFGAAADRPVAGHSGHVYVATDTGIFSWDDGVAWHSAMTLDVVQTISAILKFDGGQDWKQIATPANPAAGYNRIYVKSDGYAYILDSSGNEARLGAPPTGACLPYFGTALPAGGYLWADGASQVIATYSILSGVIRPTTGGADGTHFYTPDFRDRFPLGADNYGQGAAGRIGTNVPALNSSTGGEDTHTLTAGEEAVLAYTSPSVVTDPTHFHSINTYNGNSNASGAIRNDIGSGGVTATPNSNAASTGITVATTVTANAGGGAHNNRPLFLGCNWVVKT